MKLANRISNPCLRTLLARRHGWSQDDLDKETDALLREDREGEFESATKAIRNFSLSSFKNYEKIENALREYVFVMTLNEIYKKRKDASFGFFFDRIASGLMIENIVEAIVRPRLRKEHTCRFIDRNGVDFEIRKDDEVLAAIQCKAEIEHAARSETGYKTLLKQLNRCTKTEDTTFALLCGYLWFSKRKFPSVQEREREKVAILQEFSRNKIPIFLLFKDQYEYSLDKSSVFKFIRLMEKILSL